MDRNTQLYIWQQTFKLLSKAIPWVAIAFVAVQGRMAV